MATPADHQAARRPPPPPEDWVTLSPRESGRRLLPAGHVLVVAAIALIVGSFLNAPGLRKTAQIQPNGWRRDVALDLTKPLADVSHDIFADRPRKAIQDALGRSGDDVIVTSISLPPARTTTPSQTGKPTLPAHRPVFTAAHPLRVWAGGDSLSIVPGESVLGLAAASSAMKPVGPVDGRVATGLTRPDVFDWFGYLRKVGRKLKPNVVVLSFGANDTNSFMTGLPAGKSESAFGSDEWIAEYRRRVGGIMDEMLNQGRDVVWIGLPVARDDAVSRQFETINAIVREEAEKRAGRVVYVDTYLLFEDEHGRYAEYLPDSQGELVRMRSPDGIHFERAGGEVVARKVDDALHQLYDLRPASG
jgi:hypothetical protein